LNRKPEPNKRVFFSYNLFLLKARNVASLRISQVGEKAKAVAGNASFHFRESFITAHDLGAALCSILKEIQEL
jgi:hypothetical protein